MLFSWLLKNWQNSAVALFKLHYTIDQALGPMLSMRPPGDIPFELTQLSDYHGGWVRLLYC